MGWWEMSLPTAAGVGVDDFGVLPSGISMIELVWERERFTHCV